MSKRHYWCGMLALSLSLLVSGLAWAEAEGGAMGRNVAEMKFGMFPGLPTCATGSVQNGDPMKGAAIILAKTGKGCSVPWHWHTASERLMIVSGVAMLEMKDAKPLILKSGGFAALPAQHVHRFLCTGGPCVFYIDTDGAFDIHYVDGQGKEMQPDEALKAVKETVAK